MKSQMSTERSEQRMSAPQILVCQDWPGNLSEYIKLEKNFATSRFMEILGRRVLVKEPSRIHNGFVEKII